MEGFESKNKQMFLGYEFAGTALATVAFNMGAGYGQVTWIFVFSILAWELSSAHFNMAITIGSFLFNYDQAQSNAKSFIAILVVQTCGTFFGTLLTYMGSMKVYGPNHDSHEYIPMTRPLCPSREMYLNPKELFTCLEKDGLYWPVFATEFMAAFILVFGWLVVRKYEARDTFTWINIIKPIFVAAIYVGASTMAATVS